MNKYRKKFERRYGVKWEYQNQKSVQRYYAFKRKRQGQQLNPDYKVGKNLPKLISIDQSHYLSDDNESRGGSTDAFSGNALRSRSGYLSPGSPTSAGAAEFVSQRSTLRHRISANNVISDPKMKEATGYPTVRVRGDSIIEM